MGLTASADGKHPWDFIVSRVARILPIYWIVTVAVGLMLLYFPYVAPKLGYDPWFLFKSLMFIPSPNPSGIGYFPVNTVGWTLNFEVLFYAVVAGSLFFRSGIRWIVVLALLALIDGVLPQMNLLSPFYSKKGLLFEFMFGVLCAHALPHIRARPSKWLGAALLAIGIAGLALNPDRNPRVIDWGIPAALLVMGVAMFEAELKRARLVKRLGDASYSVYLLHAPFLFVGHFLMLRYQFDIVATIACCLLLILVASDLSFRWIEVPLGRRVNGLLRRRKSIAA